MADVTSLLDSEQMSEKLRGVVSAERLEELAASQMVPHYMVDGNVLFGASETKEWINHNLVVRHPGKHLGNGLLTIVNIMPPSQEAVAVPLELRAIAGMLIPISMQSCESVGCPGVYFLCHEGNVVYVGQSGNVFGRIGAHLGDKTFDSVFFARVPQSDLDFVEGELIRTLSPKYNHNKAGKLVTPRFVDVAEYESSISCVAAVRSVACDEDVSCG